MLRSKGATAALAALCGIGLILASAVDFQRAFAQSESPPEGIQSSGESTINTDARRFTSNRAEIVKQLLISSADQGPSDSADPRSISLTNDSCLNPTVIFDGTTSFNTFGATTDGPDEPTSCNFFNYTQVGSDIWYCYTATCTGTVTVSLCGSSYDTKIAIYQGCGCPSGASAIACNDDSCSLQSQLTFPAVAGQLYMIRVGGYLGATGSGVINISCSGASIGACCLPSNSCIETSSTSCSSQGGTFIGNGTTCSSNPCGPVCTVTCAPGDVVEGEPACGLPEDHFNGGCNSSPPAFGSSIFCGQTVCGTSGAANGVRDTDWYLLNLSQTSTVTWQAIAEFPVQLLIITPAPSCPNYTVIGPSAAAPCTLTSLTAACLPPGTYWLFISPQTFADLPCGSRYEATVTCQPCGAPTGACCVPSFSCTVITQASCGSQGGTYHGDFTSCVPEPCVVPTGACCLPGGVCNVTTSADCNQQSGTYQGNSVSCSPSPCTTQPVGACCITNGDCVDNVTPSQCAEVDGDYHGNGSICSAVTCTPPPTGACCSPAGCHDGYTFEACWAEEGTYQGDGTLCGPVGACCIYGICAELSADCCAAQGGSYHGDGVFCDEGICDIGACCFTGGSCSETSPTDCSQLGGNYLGNGSTCSPDNPCAEGACCLGSGECQIVSEAQCLVSDGTFQGMGTTCDTGLCYLGACCISGGCTILHQSACENQGGVYHGHFTTCSPNPCVIGACCYSNGTCIETDSGHCAGIAGTYFGDFSTCSANPCLTGACCAPSGCTEVSANNCTLSGGIYQGDFTHCASMPCIVGACCFSNGGCVETSPSGCAGTNGLYHGDGTQCTAGLCQTQQGACCLPDGSCMELITIDCSEFGGNYQGDNTLCGSISCPPQCQNGTGDMDNNCLTDGRDIQRFSDCVITGDPSLSCRCADFDNDGVPTTNDIPYFVSTILGGGGGPAPENPYGVLTVEEVPSPEPIPPPNPKQHKITATWWSIKCGIERIKIINVTTATTLADETVANCPTVYTVTVTAGLNTAADVIQTTVQTCGPNPGHPCCQMAATDEVKGCSIQGATYMTVADEQRTDKEARTLSCAGAPANSAWSRDKEGEGDVTPATGTGATYAITAQHESKPVDDLLIQRTHKDGDGDDSYSSSKLTVTAIDIKLHKPAVIDTAEPEVPDADELTKGVQTFVNLDNDDNDKFYDTKDTVEDTDVAGEDEMCKIRLRIKPKDLPTPAGNVKLEAFAGGTKIKIWKKANKDSEYTLGTNIPVPAEFTVVGDWLEKTLWIEGREPSTAKQDVKLRMTYDAVPTFKDEVALTIVGIEKIEWVGRNNSNADNNTLDPDPDPNWPTGLLPGAVRVFPDARLAGTPAAPEADPRDMVDVKVTLSVDPIENLKIYFDSFDVDDPSSKFGPLDGSDATHDEDQERDNRGAPQDGRFVKADGTNDETGGLKEAEFATKNLSFQFRVTMQPGDNFRVVGNGDKDFFAKLINRDPDYKNDNQAKQYIIHEPVTGSPAQRQIRDVDKYASNKILTVWRNLHVEVDSMGNVAGNTLTGNITALNTGDSNTATEATLSTNLATEGSWDLGDPAKPPCFGTAPLPPPPDSPQNGRFEAGTLRVANAHNITALKGNGGNFVRKTPNLNICATALPYAAAGGGGATMTGTVTRVDNGSVRLKLVPNAVPMDWNVYVGGTISVGGGPAMNITAVDGPNSNVTVNGLRVPFTLRDDDTLQDGTDVPDPDTTGIDTVYGIAFIRPLFDTGKNTPAATFRLNTRFKQDFSPHNDESRGSPDSTIRYWVVQLKNGYQTDINEDNDADREGTWRGAGGRTTAVGRAATIILEESLRDWIAGSSVDCGAGGLDPDTGGAPNRQVRRLEVINHEIGHTFGLIHSDGNLTNRAGAEEPHGGVMTPTAPPPGLRKSSNFTRLSLHKIRSRQFPG